MNVKFERSPELSLPEEGCEGDLPKDASVRCSALWEYSVSRTVNEGQERNSPMLDA